ncbi:MAG: PQQ-binding-like beta-propeller repeat protein [Alphaproteobacteria bacterium]|nr:PQQ-binding-like beta-propeller repeat protein [Alphaproteobacteria bacterium]
MLKHNFSVAIWCIVLALILGGCSSDKEIPQGKRISVLEQASSIKPDVSNGDQLVKIAEPETNVGWWQNDYNAQHIIPHVNTGTDFNKQWTSNFGKGRSKREILLAKPLINAGYVYTLDAEGLLSAYNIKDGENIWRMELISENSNIADTALKGAGVATDGKIIYVTTGFGSVVAVKAKDGAKVWENSLKTPLRIAPVIAAGKVLVQSADNRFFALDAQTGEILWDYDIAMENTTVVGGASAAYCPKLDVIISGFSGGEIQAFNASLGTPLWEDNAVSNRQAYSSTFLHSIKASPVVEDETAYILGNADVLAALDIRSGNRNWEKEIGGVNTPLLSGNTLFVVSNDNDLLAINKANGDILWSTSIELGGKVNEVTPFSPILMNNQLVLALSNGRINVYNPKNGQKVNMIDLDEDLNSAPVVADGYIVFTTAKAKLLVYK